MRSFSEQYPGTCIFISMHLCLMTSILLLVIKYNDIASWFVFVTGIWVSSYCIKEYYNEQKSNQEFYKLLIMIEPVLRESAAHKLNNIKFDTIN